MRHLMKQAIVQHPLYDWLSRTRRDFHKHPELSLKEVRTTTKIKEILKDMDIETTTPETLKTGALGLIPGKKGGKTLALRADIDALPVTEGNNVPYKSLSDGVMHACGHDAHITIILGVAKNIMTSGIKDTIKGNIKLILQPAEEKITGAREMIRAGVLNDPQVDSIMACHMDPDLPVGQASIYRGVSHAAADHFKLIIRGKGAHGARPEQGIDPVLAGAHFMTTIQSVISRNVSPMEPGVITIGSFQAGTAGNIIPEEAILEGTIRSLSTEVRDRIIARISEIVNALEQTFGVTTDFQFLYRVPPCINDKTVSALLYEASASVLGSGNLIERGPTMGAEDFALFNQLVPGSIMRLGCANKERGIVHKLHSPHFDLDEDVLVIGIEIFTEAVKRYLV